MNRSLPKTICLIVVSSLLYQIGLTANAANKARIKRAITRLKFDPTAEKVELFSGMQSGQLKTKIIAKNEQQGKVLITNQTDQPLTIKLPQTFIAVPVLNQQLPPFGGNSPNNFGNNSQGSQTQTTGNGFNSQGFTFSTLNNNANNSGSGQNFFSIPPEQTVSLPYLSVCLNHGLKNPNPRTKMRMVSTHEYTQNKALRKLLLQVASGQHSQKAVQAAAWFLASRVSWNQLEQKQIRRLGGVGATPYFTKKELAKAKTIVEQVTDTSANKPGNRRDKQSVSRIIRSQSNK